MARKAAPRRQSTDAARSAEENQLGQTTQQAYASADALAAYQGTTPPTNPGPTTSGTGPTAAQQADAQNLQSASSVISSTLASMGLGAMSTWANNLASSLAGQGMSSSAISDYITQNINNPLDANGQVDQAALAAFNAAMPGYNARIANGYGNGAPGGGPGAGIAAYQSYMTQIQAFGSTAGLTAGTITQQMIGNAWAGDVSTSEMSDRITAGYVQAMNAPQQVKDYLSSNLGVNTGDLASYYLNPSNTLQKLQQNLNTASVGGAANLTGFASDLGTAQAQSLAAFLASSNTSGIGGVGSITEPAASSAFTSSLGSGMTSAAGMAKAGFEQALPGQAQGPGVLSQDQMVAAIEGDSGALVSARRATETRSAASRGGGGFETSTAGAGGVGYGSQE